jgi:hypothetical protein
MRVGTPTMRSRSLKKCLVIVAVQAATVMVLTVAFAQGAAAQTIVAGTITQNTTWQGEILITDHVVVAPGATLTILPGTRVEFRHYRGYREPERRLRLDVEGSIVAVGNAARPIYFTSDAADPQNGDWSMLHLGSPTGPARFDYCVFEFALQGLNAWNASPELTHCVFRWHNWEGVYFESYCKPTLTFCQIYENGYNGLAAEQSNTIVMDQCEIWRNGTNGVHIDNSACEIRRSLIHDNRAHGLSVDDAGSLRALGDAIYSNRAYGIGVGEGSNTVEIGNLDIHDNNGGIAGAYSTVASSFYPPASIDIGFSADQSHALGYIPGDQQLDGYLYVYPDDETRRIVRKMGAGLGLTWALAWDGRYIWASTVWAHVYKLDPQSGQVLEDFVPAGSPLWGTPLQPWGMTFDDEGYMWLLDFAARKIFKIDPSTHSIVYSIDSPNPTQGGCKGLAWDGTHLCVMGWVSPVIYRMTKTGSLVDTISLDRGGGGGLTWDGEYFWCPGSRGIAKYDRSGRQVGWIYAASEGTWDLAWDGTYLWASQRTNENWSDAKIYELEIVDDHSAQAPGFPDVDAGHPYYGAITDLASRGIILGKEDGKFYPEAPVTRQQFAKMIVKALELPVSADDACPFVDVPRGVGVDPLYPDKYVAVCARHGITKGKDDTHFAPYDDITRQQLITMIVRAAGLPEPGADFDPGFPPARFYPEEHYRNARKAAHAGLLQGLVGLGPAYDFFGPATRGEVCLLLYNLVHR